MKKQKNRERKNRIVFYLNDRELKHLANMMTQHETANREAFLRSIIFKKGIYCPAIISGIESGVICDVSK